MNRQDGVVSESVLHAVNGKPPVLIPIQAGFVRADPERAFVVLKESLYQVPGEPIFSRVVSKGAIFSSVQAARLAIPEPEPHVALPVLVNRVDVISRETVLH